jgi:hypothetical protein
MSDPNLSVAKASFAASYAAAHFGMMRIALLAAAVSAVCAYLFLKGE